MKMGSSCTVSSAASAGYGLGSASGPNYRENWEPRKIEIKGWVTDWPMREMTGLSDEQVMQLPPHLEGTSPKEVTYFDDRTYSKDNQGTWSKKTMVSLWFMTTTSKGQMIASLKTLRQTSRTDIS